MNVRAKYVFEIHDFAMFSSVFDLIKRDNLSFLVIGEGSDVLFTEDYEGVLIVNKLKGFEYSEDKDFYYVKVQSGEILHEIIEKCLKLGIYGLENLALIPGTVGAAPVQNVGAYGVSLSDFCRYVEVLDLYESKLDRIWAKDCEFGYRTSIFKTNQEYKSRYIITAVELKLPKEWKPRISYKAFENYKLELPEDIFKAVCDIRKQKLPNPKEIGNAGSFFKNPIISKSHFNKLKEIYNDIPSYEIEDEDFIKIAAAWLIDKAGCKGLKLGRAGTYEKQALVLINYGDATPMEIINVAKYVINSVLDKFGVRLEPEVRIYGSVGECMDIL
jgi:UDP-N-acetylmuramate dehydrogenase